MKNIILKSAAAIALCVCFTLPASAQQTKILTADKHNEYGLVYSLPLTALEVNIRARHTQLKAGPYAQYARKYLGTDKVVTADADRWEILEVEVRPYGTLDTETKYLMQLKPGALTYIGVAEDGMLLSINAKPRPEAPEPNLRPAPRTEQTPFSGKEYLKYVNEDFTSALSSAKQAQMLAESLMEIRDSYLSLTRGTADNMPTDGRQLELMLNSLHDQESALTAAFTGTEWSETITRRYTYIPEDNGIEMLLRFSDFAGFCEADDLAGAPVNLSVKITAEGELPADGDGNVKQLPKDAVRYCIPGNALITIDHEGKTLYSRELEFSQFGVEFGLIPSLFTDRKEPSYAIFSPVTGGLTEIGTMSAGNE